MLSPVVCTAHIAHTEWLAHQPYGAVIRTDGSNRFAYHTMTERLPDVVRGVLQHNRSYDHATALTLTRLMAAVRDNACIPYLALPAPDYDEWTDCHDRHEAATWLNTDWFFAEMYFYRHILSAVRWWETGHDPYQTIKRQEMLNPTLWRWIDQAESAPMNDLWALALWGNRQDLCHACCHNNVSNTTDALLMDDREAIEAHLSRTPGDIHWIADNTGTELAMDLCLISRILQCSTRTVYLHVKMAPTLVSDATQADVQYFLDMLDTSRYTRLAEHLKAMVAARRLRIVPDPFWNGPELMSALPNRLRMLFRGSALVVFKGDMHYRRLVDDRLGPCDLPLETVLDWFPAPVAVLRLLKSDPLFGFSAHRAAALDAVDPDWHTNGSRGVIQFCLPSPYPPTTRPGS
ncbi:MAG: DUF89 family protein [Anaerolineae bacterium]|nr:DUF89 family protein [Anaerolineae bacterium]